MVEPRRRHRQLAVFIIGLLFANFPALALVDRITLPGGVPLTPIYLFVVWLGIIALAALAVVRPRG